MDTPTESRTSSWLLRYHRHLAFFAITLTGLLTGYLAGLVQLDGTVVAALLTAVLSVSGGSAIYCFVTRPSDRSIIVNVSSYLLILIISLSGGILAGTNYDVFRDRDQQQFQAKHTQFLLHCSETEFRINQYRNQLLSLPPVSHSNICPDSLYPRAILW